MKNIYSSLFVVLTGSCVSLSAQNVDWESNLGGSSSDISSSVETTADGGLITLGETESDDHDVSNLYGISDIWVIKQDSAGNLEWEKNYGGSNSDEAAALKVTSDGGYIFTGSTQSTDHDVSGNKGSTDIWVVKLDSVGNIEWENVYGGSDRDFASDIIETASGNFVVAGSSESNDGDLSGNYGEYDVWIFELDVNGNIQWEGNFGGSLGDEVNDIEQTSDGEYIAAGFSASNDHDVSSNNGSEDYWIFKLDASGNLNWENNLGGSSQDMANSIEQTPDGGYIVAGSILSNDGDILHSIGGSDLWIAKLDASGSLNNLNDAHSFGGSSFEVEPLEIKLTSTGNYLIGCSTQSDDNDISNLYGQTDMWVLMVDTNGFVIWEQNFGGSDLDFLDDIAITSGNNVVITGRARSSDHDVSANYGSYDIWTAKILSNNISYASYPKTENPVRIAPNPAKDEFSLHFHETTSDPLQLRLCDVNGRQVLKKQIRKGVQKFSVNTSSLAGGLYLYYLNGDDSSEQGKIMLVD